MLSIPLFVSTELVLGIRLDCRDINKSVFLLWVSTWKARKNCWVGGRVSMRAKFWLNVVTELKNRGLNDILIACVDGLKGFPDAINAVYPEARIQLCIVHMVRNSLRFVSWKDVSLRGSHLHTDF